jgi:hypothetical protein
MWAHWSTGSTSDQSVEVGSDLLIYSTRNVRLTMLSHSTRFEFESICASTRG